ncbi:unnamed protein product, partial [Mesorhabditis spiculigera]
MRLLLCLFAFCVVVSADAFRCYQCNSDQTSKCVDDYEAFLKVCPSKSIGGKAHKPIGCRKTDQHVGAVYTLIRECAYTGENLVNKNSKGSTGVSRTINQCNDKMGCNDASSITFFAPLVALAGYALLK